MTMFRALLNIVSTIIILAIIMLVYMAHTAVSQYNETQINVKTIIPQELQTRYQGQYKELPKRTNARWRTDVISERGK